MARTQEISEFNRAQIIVLHRQGRSEREIAKIVKISKNGVHTTIQRHLETGGTENKKRSGRPRTTSEGTDLAITVMSKRNRFLTVPEVAAEINTSNGKNISLTTIRKRLAEVGLNGRGSARKPLLRAVNKKKKIKLGKNHVNWTMEQWKAVLWTDESKFEVFGSRRRQYVRRLDEERYLETFLTPTVKHGGGSVMVWGCFTEGGVGKLRKIDGSMRKEQYHRILQNSAIPSGIGLAGYGFIFQQDNDPKHTSRLCKNYLETKEAEGVLEVMISPPQSPDLNPIELLWEELDRKVRETTPKSQTAMWEALQQTWNTMDQNILAKLVRRMPRLCKAVIIAKGGHFDEKNLPI
jgi:transposase